MSACRTMFDTYASGRNLFMTYTLGSSMTFKGAPRSRDLYEMLADEGTVLGRARNDIRDNRRAFPRNITLEGDHERATIGWCLAPQ
eukprot:9471641-Pyramimonas_sp.AAC.1